MFAGGCGVYVRIFLLGLRMTMVGMCSSVAVWNNCS